MNRFRKMKTFGLVLALVLAVVMTGCASAATPTPAAATPTAAPTVAPAVTVKWVILAEKQDGSDAVWAEVNKLVAEKLPNTSVEFITAGFGGYADKINGMIAAGEDFDIMWASDWLGDYIGKVNAGAFQPIDVLMDQYAPKLKTFVPEWMLNAGLLNGKIYGLLNYQQLWRSFGIVTRDTIATKYSLDMAKFATDSANRSLKSIDVMKNDLEPALAKAFADTSKAELYILNSSGLAETMLYRDLEPIYSVASIDKFAATDVKVVNTYKTQAYKDMIALAADWYAKGYIRKDITTAANPSTLDERKQYVVEIGNAGTPEDFNIEMTQTFGEPTSGSSFAPIYIPYNAGSATMNFINAKSKNPDRAIQLLELVNTDATIYNTMVFGIEGVQYTMPRTPVADDVVPMQPIAGAPAYGLYDWVVGNVANSWGRYKAFVDYRFTKWNAEGIQSPVFGFRPTISAIQDDVAKCNAVIEEYKYLMSGADKDYLTHYDEFIAKLDAAGAENILAELQTQVDSFLKK